jgi:hypothetical protein
MTYPKAYFATPDGERPGTSFVLMPFAPEFEHVYDAIRGAMEDAGFTCRRADELFGGDQVMVGVLQEISHAELLIADLTGRNPNVFYELGIAHMTKDAARVLLIAQRVEDIPFDIRAYRHIQYSTDTQGLVALRDRIVATARSVGTRAHRLRVTGSVGISKTQPLFPGPDRHLYSLELSSAMIGYRFVKCGVKVWRHGVGVAPEIVENTGYGFKVGETRSIGRFPWQLRLDSASESEAEFAIVYKAPSDSD